MALAYEKFGLKTNPFAPNKPNPLYFVYEDLAHDVLEILRKEGNSVIVIQGAPGMGKTTFLIWLVLALERFKINTVYINGVVADVIDPKKKLEEVLKPRGFFKKKVRSVIIIDDADQMKDPKIVEKAIAMVQIPDMDISVVLSISCEPEETLFWEKLRTVDMKLVRLEMPPKDVVIRMIEQRLRKAGSPGFEPFSVDEINNVIEISKTLREVLINLEKRLESKIES